MDSNYDNVLFFKLNKKMYFKYQDKIYEMESYTINHLNEKILLPFTFEFFNCTRMEIISIIKKFYDKDIELDIGKSNNNRLHYIITFLERKNMIDAIKIPHVCNFYGRVNDINPYTIINLNNKRILLEVTKNYAKQNEGDYYFLFSDLTESERTFFGSCYVLLEYDFLCKMEDNYKDKTLSKVLKFK